jgi:hypothetical protein
MKIGSGRALTADADTLDVFASGGTPWGEPATRGSDRNAL